MKSVVFLILAAIAIWILWPRDGGMVNAGGAVRITTPSLPSLQIDVQPAPPRSGAPVIDRARDAMQGAAAALSAPITKEKDAPYTSGGGGGKTWNKAPGQPPVDRDGTGTARELGPPSRGRN